MTLTAKVEWKQLSYCEKQQKLSKPYCQCVRGKQGGWKKNAEGDWVCSKCDKPSRPTLERKVREVLESAKGEVHLRETPS